jgi:Fe-S-cluster containining protein
MPLTEEDATRLEKLGHDRAQFSRVDSADRVLYLQTVPRAEGMTDAGRSEADISAGKPGRPCFFLKDNKCSVYADRPAGCRIYPFVMTPEGRLMRDGDCPHAREFPVDPSAGRRIQRIAAALSKEAGRRR